jgi:hypothetical protein
MLFGGAPRVPPWRASQIAQTCDIMDFGRDPTDLWNPHNLSRKIIAVRSQAGYDPIPATTLSQAVVGFGRAELYRQASVEFPDRNPQVRLPLTPQNGVVHIQDTEIHLRFTLDSFFRTNPHFGAQTLSASCE